MAQRSPVPSFWYGRLRGFSANVLVRSIFPEVVQMNKAKVLFSRVAQSRVARGLVVAGVSMAAGVANAADGGIDISAAVTAIAAAVVTISALGVAGLSVVVTVRTFKWVRGAI
ncbi:MAG: major capsid protein [Rhodocyclaceae bacterium]